MGAKRQVYSAKMSAFSISSHSPPARTNRTSRLGNAESGCPGDVMTGPASERLPAVSAGDVPESSLDPLASQFGEPMLNRRPFLVLSLSLALGTAGLLAGMGRAAPVPKTPAKITDTELAATAATDDPAKMANNEHVSTDNLKTLALAVHNYADTNGILPNDIADKNGKSILSWRVRLLPYIEQGELYKRFRIDEPWDSENNLKLVERMPKTLTSPRVTVKKPGFTVYQGFAGPGSVFEPGKVLHFPASITDGTSNTIMIAESSVAVPWTKPADLAFNPDKDLPDFGKAYGAKPLVALCDSSVRIVNTKTVSEETLKSAITTAGGEVLGADW